LRGIGFKSKFVDHAEDRPIDQLRILASAERVAVSNSSFAWWGAWLGDVIPKDQGRVVYCPPKWLAGPDSIAPKRWIRVFSEIGE
jgi:hypothetical protein